MDAEDRPTAAEIAAAEYADRYAAASPAVKRVLDWLEEVEEDSHREARDEPFRFASPVDAAEALVRRLGFFDGGTQDYRLWVNHERTVMVRLWLGGSMEVALRSHRDAIWGAPVIVVPEALS
jgi:hypothetical protein